MTATHRLFMKTATPTTARTPRRGAEGSSLASCSSGGVAIRDALLTVEQAADRLGTSVRFIRRLIAERRIPFYKIGRHVRIAPPDLEDYITASRIDPQR